MRFIPHAFFTAALIGCAIEMITRYKYWTFSIWQPTTDIPALALLGILAHFVFKRERVQ